MKFKLKLSAINAVFNVAIATNSLAQTPPPYYYKTGESHVDIDSANNYSNVLLAQGSLGIQHNQALGNADINLNSGTILKIADGIKLSNNLKTINTADTNFILSQKYGSSITVPASTTATAIHVNQGTAWLNGNIFGSENLQKTGAGSLILNWISLPKKDLHLKHRGLKVNFLWFGEITTETGTTLGGTGTIGSANVAGKLQPGLKTLPGSIMISTNLQMQKTATTEIRLGTQYDQIIVGNQAKLNGGLILKTPKQLNENQWVILKADSINGRYSHASSDKRYMDPIIKYTNKQVIVMLKHNQTGLNHINNQWYSAIHTDSRFTRESAITNSQHGKPWARSWYADTETTPNRQTWGTQIGNSWQTSPNTHIALFAGTQKTHSTGFKDKAVHIGFASHINGKYGHINMGYAHSWHTADITRQPDPSETIKYQTHARSQQAWLEAQTALAINPQWSLKPYTQIIWQHSQQNPLRETNPSLAAVNIKRQSHTIWQAQIGIKINSQWQTKHGTATMQTKFAINTIMGKRSIDSIQSYNAASSQTYTTTYNLPRTSARLDIGVYAPIAKHSHIQLSYSGQYAHGMKQHGIWFGFSQRF